MPNLTGKMLGKVHVDMFLAKGGMAEVYIGTHTTLHRSVAVKLLKADLEGEPELRERFEREARVIAMLRHPNIVQIYDFDSYGNQPYLVMEYVPGTSLGIYLRSLHEKNERLDYQQIQSLLNKIASALNYAHDNNVVHRDVKPANILLTSRSSPISTDKPLPADVEPILTDFGLVRFTQSTKQTSTGTITGTPSYMSPEQARGDRVDARTDVYSLGITVYEMLAGRVPFDADTTLSVLHQQIYDPPPPIDGLSKGLQAVIDRALEKDPEKRFQTPLEFASAFEAALSKAVEAETVNFASAISKSLTKTRQKTSLVVEPPRKKRGYVIPIAIAGLAIVVVVGALMAAGFPSKASDVPTVTPTIATATAEDHGAMTLPASSETPAEQVPPPQTSEPIGVLRFQDGSAKADQVTLSITSMPGPPEGSQYEAWLLDNDGESLLNIGVIELQEDGSASLTYVDDQGRNLIGQYHGLQITIEPKDGNPNPSNEIAFSSILPSGGVTHVRHLLYSFGSTPNQTAFLRGLDIDTALLNDLSEQLLSSFESGNEEGVRLTAEQMLNLVVGDLSEDHKDWDGNGTVDDPGDGYGLLLNGTNSGYIQGTYTHANLAITSPDATENMLVHGEHVMISAENTSGWTAQLRTSLIGVLQSPSLIEAEGAIRQSVVLANQIRNGVDINGNENIEPIPGEGGVVTAYNHAYYMADIVIVKP